MSAGVSSGPLFYLFYSRLSFLSSSPTSSLPAFLNPAFKRFRWLAPPRPPATAPHVLHVAAISLAPMCGNREHVCICA